MGCHLSKCHKEKQMTQTKVLKQQVEPFIHQCKQIIGSSSILSLLPFEQFEFASEDPLSETLKLPSDNDASTCMKAKYQSSTEVAVKVLDLFCFDGDDEANPEKLSSTHIKVLSEFVNELKVYDSIGGLQNGIDGIVSLVGVLQIPEDYCEENLHGLIFPFALVFRWVSTMSLRSFLTDEAIKHPLHHKLNALLGLTRSVEQLHSRRIVHGNLASDNILVAYQYETNETTDISYSPFELTIADFGTAQVLSDDDITNSVPSFVKGLKERIYGPEFNSAGVGESIFYSFESETYALTSMIYELVLNLNLETNKFDETVMMQRKVDRDLILLVKRFEMPRNKPKLNDVIRVLTIMKQKCDTLQKELHSKKLSYLQHVVNQREFKEIVDLVCLKDGRPLVMDSANQDHFADLHLQRITDYSELKSRYSAEDFDQANRVEKSSDNGTASTSKTTNQLIASDDINQNMIIIGCASSGKTCAMRRKMFMAAQKTIEILEHGSQNTEDIRIPIFLRLRKLIQPNGAVIAFEDLIKLEYEEHKDILLELLSIGSRQLLLLLDGLDEAAHHKIEVLDKIVTLMTEKPFIKVMMTTRETGFDERAYEFFKNQPIFRLQPLTRAEQENIIKLRLSSKRELVLQEKLIKLLETKSKIQRIAQTPLLVSLLVSIVQKHSGSEKNSLINSARAVQVKMDGLKLSTRYDMYEESLSYLLFDYAIKRDDGRPMSTKKGLYDLFEHKNRDNIWRVFEVFSFNVHRAGTKHFHDLNNLRKGCNINDEYKREGLAAIVDKLKPLFESGQIPLFCDVGEVNRVPFNHLSFQEFFVARHLKRQLEAHFKRYTDSFIKRFPKLCEKISSEVLETKFVPDQSQPDEFVSIHIQDPWFQEALIFLAGGLRRDHFKLFGEVLIATNDSGNNRRLTLLSLMCDERYAESDDKLADDKQMILELRKKIEDEMKGSASATFLARQINHPSKILRNLVKKDKIISHYKEVLKKAQSENQSQSQSNTETLVDVERFVKAWEKHIEDNKAIYYYSFTFLPNYPSMGKTKKLDPFTEKIIAGLKDETVLIYCNAGSFGKHLVNLLVRVNDMLKRSDTSIESIDIDMLISFLQLIVTNLVLDQSLFSSSSKESFEGVRFASNALCLTLMNKLNESSWRIYDQANIATRSQLKTLFSLLVTCIGQFPSVVVGAPSYKDCMKTLVEFNKRSNRAVPEVTLAIGNFIALKPYWPDFDMQCKQVVTQLITSVKSKQKKDNYWYEESICAAFDAFIMFVKSLDRSLLKSNKLSGCENKILNDIERFLKEYTNKSTRVLCKMHETRLALPSRSSNFEKQAMDFIQTNLKKADDTLPLHTLLKVVEPIAGKKDNKKWLLLAPTILRISAMPVLNPEELTVWDLDQFSIHCFTESERNTIADYYHREWSELVSVDANTKFSDKARIIARYLLLFSKNRNATTSLATQFPLDVLLECSNLIAANFSTDDRIIMLKTVLDLAGKHRIRDAPRHLRMKDVAMSFWTICGADLITYATLKLIPASLNEFSKEGTVHKFYTFRNRNKYCVQLQNEDDLRQILSLLKEAEHAPFLIDDICSFISKQKNLPERTRLWHESGGADVVKQILKGGETGPGYIEARALNIFVNGQPVID